MLGAETGCGKTTLAQWLRSDLLSINCHERTEAADLVGRLRPNPDAIFTWQDGVLVQTGQHLVGVMLTFIFRQCD
jgi:midasin